MSALLRTHTTWNDSRVSIHISLSLSFILFLAMILQSSPVRHASFDANVLLTCFSFGNTSSRFVAFTIARSRSAVSLPPKFAARVATTARLSSAVSIKLFFRSAIVSGLLLQPWFHRVSLLLPLSLSLSLSPSSAFLLLDGVLYVYVASA